MGMSNYDAPNRVVRRFIQHNPTSTGLSVPGTAAADTVLLRILIPEAITVSGSARIRLTTGGTAAGPTVLICKSLAGTATAGTANSFGTFTSGTAADGTSSWVTLTSTDFAAGDEIVLVNKAGTAAATPVMLFALGYVEALA
jgi:hypothetical protein